jgi:hypothetical protein
LIGPHQGTPPFYNANIVRNFHQWNIAASKLEGFAQNLPSMPDEDDVAHFHEIVTLFEEASGQDLSTFRISPDRMKPRAMNLPMFIGPGGPPSVVYSENKYCEGRYFKSQVQGFIRIVKSIHDDFDPPEQSRSTNPPAISYNLRIDHMHNSAIVQGSPGASVQQQFDVKSQDFSEVFEKLKTFIAETSLCDEDRAHVDSDVATIEAQISSPKPKSGIIRECLHSLRTILETAVGNVIAATAFAAIMRYFPN